MQRHSNRQAYEWKVSLSLWAAILVSATVLNGVKLALWVPFIIPLLYAMFWLRGLWISNEYDKLRYKYYRRQAALLLANPDHLIDEFSNEMARWKRYLGFLTDWAMQFHFLATLSLSLLVWAYVNGKLVSAS